MSVKYKTYLLFVGKVAVAVGLVLFLVERIDWSGVLSRIVGVSVPLLSGYVLVQLSGNVISARKWQFIAAFKGLLFPVRDGFFAYLTGAFINNFLPSTIGGDAYRGVWLARRTGARAASLASVVFDRFIGLWTMAILALFFMGLLFNRLHGEPAYLVVLAAVSLFLLGDAFLTFAYFRPWFGRLVALFPFKLRRLAEEIISFTRRGMWLTASLYSALFAFVGVALSNYLLFLSLGESVPVIPYLGTIFLVTIISSVPLSINNIGIKEWAYLTFFGLVGISAETAVTVALLSRFLQMCISFGALPHYLATRGK